ncbi:MAG: MBL fold metallo-hydrolase [Patescibacteria group bacterium]
MFKDLTLFVEKHRNKFIVLIIALVILDVSVWGRVFALNFDNHNLNLYFLDVGQGDSQLVILPGGVKILIDGGQPNGKVLEELGKILPPTDRYIDLVMMSHPQLDHFGGLIEVLKRYKVGAFLTSGREGTIQAFKSLKETLEENKIKTIILGKGDKVHYLKSAFDVLSPDKNFVLDKELNNTSLVVELESNNSKTLFTGDIGFDIENHLLAENLRDISILKVAHHGSKYSSLANFLQASKPEVAVIGVGKNSYGHPTKETLGKLRDIGASIFRTDKNGTVQVLINGNSAKIFSEK